MNTENFLTAGQARLLMENSSGVIKDLKDIILKESFNGFDFVDLSIHNFPKIEDIFNNFDNYMGLLHGLGYSTSCSQTIITISWRQIV